jgi:hypothetical protein
MAALIIFWHQRPLENAMINHCGLVVFDIIRSEMETTVLGMKGAAKQQQIFWMPKKKEGHLRRTENDVTHDW